MKITVFFICLILVITIIVSPVRADWWDDLLGQAQSGAQQIIEQGQKEVGGVLSCLNECYDKCSGNTRYYSAGCVNGKCTYQTEFCQYGCEDGMCIEPKTPEIKSSSGTDKTETTSSQIDWDVVAVNVLKNVPVYNPDTGKIESYDTVMRRIVGETEDIEGSDIEKDPVQTTYFMMFKEDYLMKEAKIFKGPSDQWLTAEEALSMGYQTNDVQQAKQEYETAKNSLNSGDKKQFETHMKKFSELTEKINSNVITTTTTAIPSSPMSDMTGMMIVPVDVIGDTSKGLIDLFSDFKNFLLGIGGDLGWK